MFNFCSKLRYTSMRVPKSLLFLGLFFTFLGVTSAQIQAMSVGNAISDISTTKYHYGETIDLSEVFSDEEDDSFSYTFEISTPSLITTSNTDDLFTITPVEKEYGSTTITINATDSDTNTATDVFTFTIAEPNLTVTAVSETLTENKTNGLQSFNSSVTLSGSDALSRGNFAYTVTATNNGTLTGTAPNLTYTPDTDFSGEDSFEYRIYEPTLTELGSFTAASGFQQVIEVDDKIIIAHSANGLYIKSYSGGASYTTVSSAFESSTYASKGIASDGTYLYAVGNGSTVYMINLENYTVSSSISGDFDYGHITYDNGFLYALDDLGGFSVISTKNSEGELGLSINASVTDTQVKGITASGSHIYVAGKDGLDVYTYDGDTTVTAVGNYDNGDVYLRVAVKGDYAYLGSNAQPHVTIIDVSTASSPTFVEKHRMSEPASGKYVRVVQIRGNYLYLLDLGYIEIYDISDPENAALVYKNTTKAASHHGGNAGQKSWFSDKYIHLVYKGGGVYASDHPDFSDTGIGTMTVTGINFPTVENAISDMDVSEDAADVTVNLETVFADVESDSADLNYVVSVSDSDIVAVSTANNVLTLDFVDDAFGTVGVTVNADDGYGITSDYFIVTVNSVNDEPTITSAISDYSPNEDASSSNFTLADIFDDVETTDGNLVISIETTDDSIISTNIASGVLSIRPKANQNGVVTVNVIATDEGGASVTDSVKVTVVAVNDNPVVSENITDYSILENDDAFTIDLSTKFSDVETDSDSLTYTAESSEVSVLTVSVDGYTLTLTPQENQIAEVTVTVNASDGSLDIEDVFIVDVIRPALVAIDLNAEVSENANVTINLQGTDTDDRTLSYTVVTNPSNGSLSGTAPTLNYEPDADYFGEDYFEYRVESDEKNLLATTRVHNSNNDIRHVVKVGDYLYIGDESYGFAVRQFNPTDNTVTDILTISETDANYTPNSIDVDSEGDYLYALVGNGRVTMYRLSNGTMVDEIFPYQMSSLAKVKESAGYVFAYGRTDTGGERLALISTRNSGGGLDLKNVQSKNISGLKSLEIQEKAYTYDGTDYEALVYVVGENSLDTWGFNKESDPTTSTLTKIQGNFSDSLDMNEITIDGDYAYVGGFGNGKIYIIDISDPSSPSLEVTLDPNNMGNSETIVSIQKVGNKLFAHSIQGKIVIYDVTDPTSPTVFNASSETYSINGEIPHDVSAFDDKYMYLANNQKGVKIYSTPSKSEIATVSITIESTNQVPTIDSAIADVTMDEDASAVTYNLSSVFSDPDSDVLTYSVDNGDDSLLSITTTNGTLSITPLSDQFGVTQVTINATDPEGASVADNFTVTVNNVNDAPTVASAITSYSANEDSSLVTFNLSDTFTDLETNDSELDFTVTFNEWTLLDVSIDGVTLSITPASDQNGSTGVTVSASDGEYSVDNYFTITINAVNDSPVLDLAITDKEFDEDGSEVTFNITDHFSDIDSVMTYTFDVGDSSILTVSTSNSVMSLTPSANQNGTTGVTVNVHDGEYTVSDYFIVTINAINDAPTLLNAVDDVTANENSSAMSVDISNVFTDIDTATENFSFTLEQSTTAVLTLEIDGTTLNITPKTDQFGTTGVTLNVSDGDGGSASDYFVVTINEVIDFTLRNTTITANNGSYTTLINTTINVSTSGFDQSEAAVRSSIENDVENGTLTLITGYNGYRYVPDEDFYGTDSFDFKMNLTSAQKSGLVAETKVPEHNSYGHAVIEIDGAYYLAETDEGISVKTITLAEDIALESAEFTAVTQAFESETFSSFTLATDGTYLYSVDGDGNMDAISISGQSISDTLEQADGHYFEHIYYDDGYIYGADPDNGFTVITTDNNGSLGLSKVVSKSLSSITDIAVRGEHIYASSTTGLKVYHYNKNDDTISDVAVSDDGNDYSTIALAGDYAYLGGTDGVLTIKDISDPANPSAVSSISVQSTKSISYIQKRGNYVFIISDGYLSLIDVTDKTSLSKRYHQAHSPYGGSPNVAQKVARKGYFDEKFMIVPVGINGFAAYTTPGESNLATVTINVVTKPTVASAIGNLDVNEDASTYNINLADVFEDLDGDSLSYEISTDPDSIVTTSMTGATLNIEMLADQNGDTDFVITANDGTYSVADTFTFTVNPVNDAPVVTLNISDQSVTEDDDAFDIDLTFHFSDIETSAAILSYNIEVGDENKVTAATSNYTLTLTPVANATGVTGVTVNASDGSLSVSDYFTVTISSVNDAPEVANSISDFSVNEDATVSTYSLTTIFEDDETSDANLYYTYEVGDSDLLDVTTSNYVLNITPKENQFGNTTVTVSATDAGGLTGSDVFIVTVDSVNDLPTVTSAISDYEADEDSDQVTFNLGTVFDDIETDDADFVYYAVSEPEWAVNLSTSNGILGVTPAEDQTGLVTITVNATDEDGGSVSDTFTVTLNNINDDPVVDSAILDVDIFVFNPITVTVDISDVFDDVDGDSLTYTVEVEDENVATVVKSGDSLVITPISSSVSETGVTVNASDGNGGSGSDYFLVTLSSLENENLTVTDEEVWGLENTLISISVTIEESNDVSNIGNVEVDPSDGSVVYSSSLIEFAYTPDSDFVGTDSFKYRSLYNKYDSTSVGPLGSSAGSKILPANDLVFVADSTYGIKVMSIDDDNLFVTESEVLVDSAHQANDLAADSDYLYSVDHVSNTSGKVRMYDMDDLSATPKELSLSTRTTKIIVQDGYVYVQGLNKGVTVITTDNNGTVDLVQLDYQAVAQIKGFDVQDKYIYAVGKNSMDVFYFNEGTGQIDSIDTDFESGLDFSTIDVEGDYAYIGGFGLGFEYIYIVDISTPSDPQLVYTYTPSYYSEFTTKQTTKLGSLLYTIWRGGSMSILDVSDPTSPTVIYEPEKRFKVGNKTLIDGAHFDSNYMYLTSILNGSKIAPRQLYSREATVTINVHQAPVVNSAISSFERDEDFSEVTFNLSDVFTEPDGQDLTFFAESSDDSFMTISTSNDILSFEALDNLSGTTNITLTATDPYEATVSFSFVVTVNAVNDSPVVSDNIVDQDINEDSSEVTFNLTSVFTDVDSVLSYTYEVGDSSILTVSTSNSVLSITPSSNQNGTTGVTVNAHDGEYTVSDYFIVTINAINDSPTVTTGIDDQDLNEDADEVTFNLTSVFSDIDSVLSYTYEVGDSSILTVSTSNSVLSIIPSSNQNGTTGVTVNAHDGEYTVSDYFIVTINAVNDSPTITTAIVDQDLDEDADEVTFNLTSVFTDIDSVLSYTYEVGDSSILTVSTSNAVLSITPSSNQNGTTGVTVNAHDGDYTVSDYFIVTINAVNDSPTIETGISDQNLNEDASEVTFNLTSVFSDIDSVLSYTYEVGDSSILTVSTSNAVLSIIPSSNENGTTGVTVNAHDGEYTVSDYFIVTINAINDSPTVTTGIDDQDLNEDADEVTFNLTSVFSDSDSVLSYTYEVGDSSILTVSTSNAVLSITPSENQSGSTGVTVNAHDGDYTVSDYFIVTINAVNDSPTIEAGISDQSLNEDGDEVTFNLTSVFSDIDSVLSYSYEVGDSSLLTVSSSNAVLSITPSPNQNGTTGVTVNAHDGEYTVSDYFIVTINAGNDSPVVSANIADQELDEDASTETINLSLYFSDLETASTSLVYSVEVADTSLLSANVSSYTLSLTPSANQYGTTTVTVNASDGQYSVNDNFIVTINAVNDTPVLDNQFVDREFSENASTVNMTLSDYFSDIDSQLSYSYSVGNSSILAVITANGVLSIQPVTDQNGTTGVTVNAHDGDYSISDYFIVTINNGNEEPVVSENVGDQVFNEDANSKNFALSQLFSDVDSILSYTFSVEDASILSVSTANSTLRLSPKPNKHGVTVVTLNAHDGEYTVSDIFTVTINAVNDSPQLDDNMADKVYDEDAISENLVLSDYFSDIDSILSYTVLVEDDSILSVSTGNNSISLEPIANQNGVTGVTVNAHDGEYTVSDYFVVTINAVNDLPVLDNAIVTQVFSEDADAVTINLTDIFSDVDSVLSYTFSVSNNSIVTLSTSNHILEIDPAANASGQASVTLNAHDEDYTVSTTFLIKINASNDSPVLDNSIGTQEFDEDDDAETIDLTTIFSDVDSDLSYSLVVSSDDSVTVTINGSDLVMTPSENQFGVTGVTVNATDGDYTVSDYFLVSINAVNDAPVVLDPISNMSFVEDGVTQSVDLTEVFDDIETSANELIISIESSSYNLFDLSTKNHVLSIKPFENAFGSATLTVNASDGELSVSDSFELTVQGSNESPVIVQPISNFSMDEDSSEVSFTLTDVFSDDETDSADLIYTYDVEDTSLLSVSTENNKLTIEPKANQHGVSIVTINASDGVSVTSDVIIVTINSINDVPVVSSSLDNYEADEDHNDMVLDLTSVFSDVEDNDSELYFTYELSNNDVLSVSTSSAKLYIVFEEHMFGSTSITLNATDSDGASVNESFVISVNAVNDIPTIDTAIADKTVYEDSDPITISLEPLFSDVETADEDLDFYVSYNNDDLFSISTENRKLQITFLANQHGSAVVTVTAIDDEHASVSDVFTVTVLEENDAPLLTGYISDYDIDEDSDLITMNLKQLVSDEDTLFSDFDITVTLSRTDVLTVGREGQIFGFVPKENQYGVTGITVNISDGVESVQDYFIVTVNPVNDAPVVSDNMADIIVNEDSDLVSIDLTELFIDVDNDSLSYNYEVSSSAVVKVGTENNYFKIRPKSNKYGLTSITLNATDGQYSVSDHFTFKVRSVNDAPVFDSANDHTVTINQRSVDGQLLASDIEGDTLSFDLVELLDHDSFTIDSSTAELMAVSTINAYATYNIIVKVSDGTDISTKSIRVIVVTDDADGDGITDEEEIADGLDPNDPTDADLDSDGDGISNKDEANNDCLDWTDSDDANADSDGDGISNKLEIAIGTDVCNPDTDGDGVPDGQDAFMYDETESVDSDGDNLGDTQEEAGIGLDDIQSAYENNTIIIDEDRTDSEKLALEECKLVVEKATTDVDFESGAEWVKCIVAITESNLMSKGLDAQNSFIDIENNASLEIDASVTLVESVLNSDDSIMVVEEDVLGYGIDLNLKDSQWEVKDELQFEGESTLSMDNSTLDADSINLGNIPLNVKNGSQVRANTVVSPVEMTWSLEDSSIKAGRLSSGAKTTIKKGTAYLKNVEGDVVFEEQAKVAPYGDGSTISFEGDVTMTNSDVLVCLYEDGKASLSVEGLFDITNTRLIVQDDEDCAQAPSSLGRSSLSSVQGEVVVEEVDYQVIDFLDMDGQFSTITLPEVDDSYEWSLADLYSQGVLKLIGTTVFDPVSIDGLALAYPNPYKLREHDSFDIGFTINKETTVEVYVYNMLSELVVQKSFDTEKHVYTQVTIQETDFSYISAGVYVYVIVHGDTVLAKGKLGVLP